MKEHSNCGIGVVADINNLPGHEIVADGIRILNRLEHRGGKLRDGSGDGAGIMTQIPREFFRVREGIDGDYYVAMTFLPKDPDRRALCDSIIRSILSEEGVDLLRERSVPVRAEILGDSARESMPCIFQYFLENCRSPFDFYRIRRRIEKSVYSEGIPRKEFYFASFSNKTIVYKGLITPRQFNEFYPDLLDESYKSAVVMVHQRFSTNTLPSWDLAHPFRVLEHNGEINTISGNRNWIESRRSDTYSREFHREEIEGIFPLTSSENSDSANLDSLVEFMLHTGRNLPETLTTLVPSAWEGNQNLEPRLRNYYEAKSLVMEPWDGPAGLITCTGEEVFAALDRNGLRPMRYTLTSRGKLIISSEMGVLDTPFEDIEVSGKLSAGEFLHLDLREGRLLSREEIIERITFSTDYREEMKNVRFHKPSSPEPSLSREEVERYMKRFSYTREDVSASIDYLQENGFERVGSTTYDISLAAMDEENPRLFFDYFRQKFAQVTNPPIDSIRESSVFSITSTYGSRKNLLDPCENRGSIHRFPSPVVNNEDIALLRRDGAAVVSTEFETDMEDSILRITHICINAAREGRNLILSDRNTRRSLPVLLITSAVHHALIREGLRGRVGLAVESGEIREIPHYALLIGYGADILNPYLVLDYLSLDSPDLTPYLTGVDKGIMKIMSKMGISSLASYRGARTYELIGISRDVSRRFMGDTPTHIGGLSLQGLERELLLREAAGCSPDRLIGEFHEMKEGVRHKDSRSNAALLYEAVTSRDYIRYKEYSSNIYNSKTSIRDLFNLWGNPIPLDEVESERSIISRFVAGAMSFGALSREAHESIATAFNVSGAMSNSGEGGEDSQRYSDHKISRVKQIASGRFGVTTNYLMNASELQIKMAQGAKPGEGGHLPGGKVSGDIARVRNTVDGIDLISPPPHHDIYSIEDLAQLIYDLRSVNPRSQVSVKLASEAGVGIIASGTAKAGADKIVISGSEGGTGAAALSSLKYAATPWELGLSDTHKTLCENKLRDLVKIQVDGGMRTGYDIVVSALLGADEYALGTGLLMAQGCIMCRGCHTNSCPVGLTTQKEDLRARYRGTPQDIVTYLRFIAQEVREILAFIGARSIGEIRGRSSLLTTREIHGYKKSSLDFTEILREVRSHVRPSKQSRDTDSLNRTLMEAYSDETLFYSGGIDNTNRSAGAAIGGRAQLDRFRHSIRKELIINLRGYAGQSFGAFAVEGQSLTLEGYANDYVGKGLSGGTIVIRKPEEVEGEAGCIAGNTLLYGATSGKLYLQGSAGERFAVRNSGAVAVVEGIGSHGCEYMTGGRVIVLGEVGSNFGAGMSGGIAYLHRDYLSSHNINTDTVEYFELSTGDREFLKGELTDYYSLTGSPRAAKVLEGEMNDAFVKVASPLYLERINSTPQSGEVSLLRSHSQAEEAAK